MSKLEETQARNDERVRQMCQKLDQATNALTGPFPTSFRETTKVILDEGRKTRLWIIGCGIFVVLMMWGVFLTAPLFWH